MHHSIQPSVEGTIVTLIDGDAEQRIDDLPADASVIRLRNVRIIGYVNPGATIHTQSTHSGHAPQPYLSGIAVARNAGPHMMTVDFNKPIDLIVITE
ncbi:hypothetical protein K8P10_001972 [Leucobacter sp. Psy1]|uniref:hypothetical protein n=1 Tax=Leucobacter sp. Psy1 TaxID=2875729 RepID=UPI001CD4D8EB|nr:hypothetical protein [Leucobacter sp. Psy1]UBH06461.1 hypothetical protein K8P10_001972 [Leucobacter sp. Psy1]